MSDNITAPGAFIVTSAIRLNDRHADKLVRTLCRYKRARVFRGKIVSRFGPGIYEHKDMMESLIPTAEDALALEKSYK